MAQSPDRIVDPDTGKTKQYAIEKMTDKNEKRVLDDNGMPIDTRVYQFTRSNGTKILIQDHSAGHKFGRADGMGITLRTSTCDQSISLEKAILKEQKNIIHSGSKHEVLE